MEDIAKDVPGLVLANCHDEAKSKISITMRDLKPFQVGDTTWLPRDLVIQSFKAMNARCCPGAAPPGHQEDVLAQYLQTLADETE